MIVGEGHLALGSMSILRCASVILVLVCCLLICPHGVCASGEGSSGEILVHEAFEALVTAYDAGGDVGPLADKLNEALALLSEADRLENSDPDEAGRLRVRAVELLNEVIEEAPRVAEEGRRRTFFSRVLLGCSLAGLGAAGVLAYRLGPGIFWRIWARSRRGYRARLRSRRPGKEVSMLASGEIWAIIASVVLVGAIFAISQAVWAGRVVETFSELGVLGPSMRIGDYPREVVAGDTFKLYIYVGNHMGRPMLYTVYIKLGNESTPVDPAPVEPMMCFTHVLLHNETWIFPVNITLTEPGLNYRLLFELWAYSPEVDRVEYLGLWCQLWINVTAPA